MLLDNPGSPGQLPTSLTLLAVALVLIGLGVAIAWAIYWWRLQKRHAAEALASVSAGPPPTRKRVLLFGTVETEEPDRPAITVTLWELGKEREGKYGWSHTWTEQRREVRAAPFYLALGGAAAGTVVRVDPDDDVFLVDALDALEFGNPRMRRAELTNGEKAYVSGILFPGFHPRLDARNAAAADGSVQGSAYRGGPTSGLVLRPGRERMLVSTEPLDQRYVRQARVHGMFVAIFGVALVLASTLLFGTTIVTQLFGKTQEVDLVTGRHWTTSGKGGPSHHYTLTGRYANPNGRLVTLEDDVNAQTFDQWKLNRLEHLPFVVAFDNPTFSNVGDHVTIHLWRGFFGIVLVAGLLGFYQTRLNAARQWYDKKRVVTTGNGRLS